MHLSCEQEPNYNTKISQKGLRPVLSNNRTNDKYTTGHKGEELKFVRGGEKNYFGLRARSVRENSPPEPSFPLLRKIFALCGHTFFSLYIVRMAKSSGGELPPPRSSTGGTSPAYGISTGVCVEG